VSANFGVISTVHTQMFWRKTNLRHSSANKHAQDYNTSIIATFPIITGRPTHSRGPD